MAQDAESASVAAAASSDSSLADSEAAVRGAVAALHGGDGSGGGDAAKPLTGAELAGLAAARLAAWRERHPHAANYQVRFCSE